MKHAHSEPPVWRFLWEIIRPYKWWYVLMLQAPIITSFYIFANNYSMKLLVDAFSIGSNVTYHQLAYPMLIFFLAQFCLDISWRLSNVGEWRAEPLARRKLLLTVYDYIQYHSYKFFQDTQSGTIISKLRGVLDGYDAVFSSLHHTIGKSFCVVFVSVFVLLIVNKTVFILMFLWCILVVMIMYPMGVKLNLYSNEAAESKHHVIGLFADNITNIFSLFYFAKRQHELQRANAFMSQDYVPRQTKMYKYDFKFNLMGSVLFWLMLISIFLFMINLRKSNAVSTGDFIFVMLTALTISFELWTFITGMNDFMKQIGDFKSSYSILSEPHAISDAPHVRDFVIEKGAIHFQNISFGYDTNKLVFEHLNLSIEPGQKVGLVGHSGAGKSTLVSLLLKNFQPSQGTIVIDGHNLNDIATDSLRRQISLIPQEIMLFHRSIADNIGYAKEDATLEEIKQAASMANIDSFIESLPDKYDTLVGERGIKLSGGQRQRIAIARAILKNSPIIILDEATSSLDTVTEQQIQQSIQAMLEDSKATVIAIAHRLSTIRHMDRIFVMDAGHVVESGTFAELMAIPHGYFKTIWDAQVNGMII